MAFKKKTAKTAKRRTARSSKAVAVRRRTTKKKVDFVGVLTMVAMAGAGYLAADYLRKNVSFVAGLDPKMQAGGLALAGAGLAVFMPSLLPVAVGLGANGVVALVQPMLQLAPPVNGIGELSESDKRLLAQFAQPMNGDDDMINGGADGMINAAENMINGDDSDRAY